MYLEAYIVGLDSILLWRSLAPLSLSSYHLDYSILFFGMQTNVPLFIALNDVVPTSEVTTWIFTDLQTLYMVASGSNVITKPGIDLGCATNWRYLVS